MIFDIRNYGAIGDGKKVSTVAIQKAIDECSCAGGGRVLVSGGTYLTGSICLKENVDLHLDTDGILLASDNCEDFPERIGLKHVETDMLPRARNASVIFAEECSNISITGNGVIDCNGSKYVEEKDDFWMPYKRKDIPTPPRVVFFTGCKNIKICDITIQNSPAGWTYWIHDCDWVTIDGIKIFARVDYPNNDGIHINCSRNVTVSNSIITCGDDCIVVRANSASLKENKVCEKITVTNCTLTTWCNAIRIGWIKDGTIRDCAFSNLVITDSSVGVGIVLPRRGEKRLLDEGRESTLIENITFDNIIFDRGLSAPIWIDIQDAPEVICTAVRNLYFNNMHCFSDAMPYICGRKDIQLKNIFFSNCSFEKYRVSEKMHPYGASSKMIFGNSSPHQMKIEYADNILFINTTFKIN